MRISDNFPIKLQPSNDEERYILEEAKLYLDETAFLSRMNSNEHTDNIVKLGKHITPFLIDFLKENDNDQGMYTHFLLIVLSELYKDDLTFEGYFGVSGAVKAFISLYDNGILDL